MKVTKKHVVPYGHTGEQVTIRRLYQFIGRMEAKGHVRMVRTYRFLWQPNQHQAGMWLNRDDFEVVK
jgi:hypothetical protein